MAAHADSVGRGAVTSAGMAGTPVPAAHELFRKGDANAEGWGMLIAERRRWESAYRRRFAASPGRPR